MNILDFRHLIWTDSSFSTFAGVNLWGSSCCTATCWVQRKPSFMPTLSWKRTLPPWTTSKNRCASPFINVSTHFNSNAIDHSANHHGWSFPLWSVSVSHCVLLHSRSTCLSLCMCEWARWRTGRCFVAGYSWTSDPSSTRWWTSSRGGAGCWRSICSTT